MVEPRLRLTGLARRYGALAAVAPLSLELTAGSFTAILGPSGCGKSTLLRMIGGFVQPSAGSIHIDGADVTRLGPEKRPVNMVFQNHGLFPHMSVAENVGFGLMVARVAEAERKRRVGEALELVRLADRAATPVTALSGGQQQRVALARALIMRPKLLLLDEPLSALDLKLRQDMQAELARIHRETGGTFLFVTHDQSEAFGLADRLIVMKDGRIAQEGAPHDVYANPASLFVAQFVGDANVLGSASAFPGAQPATLVSAVHLGASARASVRLADGREIQAVVKNAVLVLGWTPGQTLHAGWAPSA
ncbi:MAG: ABC transporter ATP-binding protein, partial [Rhizobiaceae bacterium]|nr:ABC transporter ATP-binding protein [Rhizobiaceae bacterium]